MFITYVSYSKNNEIPREVKDIIEPCIVADIDTIQNDIPSVIHLYGKEISEEMEKEIKLAHELEIAIEPMGIVMKSLYRKLKFGWK